MFDSLLGDSEDVAQTEDKPEVAEEDDTKPEDEVQQEEDTAEQPETIAEQPEESEVTDQVEEQ